MATGSGPGCSWLGISLQPSLSLHTALIDFCPSPSTRSINQYGLQSEGSPSHLEQPSEQQQQDIAKMFSTKRLKKKSQSVDIATQGFSPTLVPASPINKTASPVTKTTTLGVQQNNATNSQRICSPRCSELRRGYTIGK
uniref:Uncharacterized protein n=2 Tax=Hucho hucho TaxID=62062 RepID=A0A4W5R910_9TELE